MFRPQSIIYLLLLVLFAAGCALPPALAAGEGVPDAVPARGAPADCPVTRPPANPFVPPEPWPASPPGQNRFWYGSPGLWTALPSTQDWHQLVLGEKFWWWSAEYPRPDDPTPDLVVTAERLDGKAPSFRTEDTTNGYHPSFHQAMLVGVELPSPGCWEFTGEFKGHTLTFVLWVPGE